jgi:hypothetical protein
MYIPVTFPAGAPDIFDECNEAALCPISHKLFKFANSNVCFNMNTFTLGTELAYKKTFLKAFSLASSQRH